MQRAAGHHSAQGRHTWETCVAACRICNSQKADRLLGELGWSLERPPRAPSCSAGGVLVLAVEPLPAWEPWLAVAA